MKGKAAAIALSGALIMAGAGWGQDPGKPAVSEKKDVAVFALGYQGWILPLEALGEIDAGIQEVFVDLGRFNVIGMTQRLSAGGLSDFIQAVRKGKEAGFVLPEKYQFGEAILTEAEFNRLLGAFIVAAPVVTRFDSRWDAKYGRWETSITTSVSFLDVASGTMIGVAKVETSGTDQKDQVASMRSALDSIPSSLSYEVRAMPAFQISTRILGIGRGEIRMQLGSNMGIVKGDEYAVTRTGYLSGVRDEREIGLVVVKEVGPEISTGVILIDEERMGTGDQLREIPRAGCDVEAFAHAFVAGPSFVANLGLRAVMTRGFYSMKPLAVVEIPLGAAGTVPGSIPLDIGFGGQLELRLGRLALSPWAAAGAIIGYLPASGSGGSAETRLSHAGAQAWLQASWLANRDTRFYGEAGAGWWLPVAATASAFGGLGMGAGVALKL